MLGQFGRLGKLGGLFSKSDVVRAIFRDATPGFSVIVDQAIKANEAALGVELVVNGRFDDGLSGWTVAGGSQQVVDGALELTVSSQYGSSTQIFPTKVGATYVLRARSRLGTSSQAHVKLRTSTGGNQSSSLVQASSWGVYTVVWVADTTNSVVEMQNLGASLGTSYYDNISVREIDLSKCQAFQDAAGTTPVVAMEQPLGLLLDTSRGLVRGPELVTNGDFSSATGWTPGAGWAISGGVATATATTININTALTFSVGKAYEVTLDLTLTSGSFRAELAQSYGPTVTTSCKYRAVLFPYTGDMARLFLYGPTAFTGSIDNISVRELPGAHLVQPSNTASRPIVKRRVNLLTATENFSIAPWLQSAIAPGVSPTVTAGFGIGPDGVTPADRLQFDAAAGGNSQLAQVHTTLSIGAAAVFRVWAKSLTIPTDLTLFMGNATVNRTVGTDWTLLEFSRTLTSTSAEVRLAKRDTWGTAGTADLLVWGADLRLTSDTLNLPPYQRVTSATDYDETGFPAYAEFDGVDDWLEHGEIDFTGTDEMTAVLSAQESGSADYARMYETGTDISSVNGTVFIGRPTAAERYWQVASRGSSTNYANAPAGSSAPPHKSVVTLLSKISTATLLLRHNGVQDGIGTGDQGTGNYGKHKGYIGRRAGTSLPAKMRFYGLTVVGKTLPEAQRNALEREHNKVVRAY